MLRRTPLSTLVAASMLAIVASYSVEACCPAPGPGQIALNADQTVIILWDAAAKQQHFIRQASFDSDAQDFGFIIPSPSQPKLEEATSAAFDTLARLTAPEIVARPQGGGCIGCSAFPGANASLVRVLETKQVAGFDAAVLEADTSEDLVTWLKDNGYEFSPAVADWAQPYIEQKWKFTALKVSKSEGENAADGASHKAVAPPLRMTFDTDRPLFPYREPDYAKLADDQPAQLNQLLAKQRLLQIFFLANERYEGKLGENDPWTGRPVWAGALTDDVRGQLLRELNLPDDEGPAQLHLTEFEDNWPYRVAPADLYFTAANDQTPPARCLCGPASQRRCADRHAGCGGVVADRAPTETIACLNRPLTRSG